MDFCNGCPHANDDETGEFDVVCVARPDAEPFLVPDECPVDLGEWGAWRAVLGHYIHPVIAEWDVCATRDQDEPSLYFILSDSEVFGAVGWSS